VNLRPLQQNLVRRVDAQFESGARTVLVQAATGFGKTFTAAHYLAERTKNTEKRAVFLAHLDQLVGDSHKRINTAGVYCGFVQAGRRAEPLARIQVCSIQTLHSRGDMPPADIVVVDEAHRSLAPTVRTILEAWPRAQIIGLTASPQRGDGKALGTIWDRLICGPQNRTLISEGYIVPWHVITPPTPTKALAMDPVDAYDKFAPNTQAIVFAASVAHAEDLAASFWRSEIIIGDTPRKTREEICERFAAGLTKVIVGVDVFTEGFDAPACETVIIARDVGVTGTFLQICGRGARIFNNKKFCTVIDLRGTSLLHGLPDEDREWSLTGCPVKRTEAMTIIQRCKACFAVFRPRAVCPRCGAVMTSQTSQELPRVLRKAEKLARLDHLSQAERDHRYMETLIGVGVRRRRMALTAAQDWAVKQFIRRFKRTPECAIAETARERLSKLSNDPIVL
jgi:superfamily II DNA or RNA helicase